MLYTLVTFILQLSMIQEIPIVNNTYTFKTLALCENALEDKLMFESKKNKPNVFLELIENEKEDGKILKISFINKNKVSYSKCVKSTIAFNKEVLKKGN